MQTAKFGINLAVTTTKFSINLVVLVSIYNRKHALKTRANPTRAIVPAGLSTFIFAAKNAVLFREAINRRLYNRASLFSAF